MVTERLAGRVPFSTVQNYFLLLLIEVLRRLWPAATVGCKAASPIWPSGRLVSHDLFGDYVPSKRLRR